VDLDGSSTRVYPKVSGLIRQRNIRLLLVFLVEKRLTLYALLVYQVRATFPAHSDLLDVEVMPLFPVFCWFWILTFKYSHQPPCLQTPWFCVRIKAKLSPCFFLKLSITPWKYIGGVDAFFDLGTRCRWVVRFTPRPHYPQWKSRWYPLDRRLGGFHAQSGSGGEEKNS
jgi:hypothetical protein